MEQSKQNELIIAAKKARENAYVPYSKFKVSAALLAEDGTIFTGCNIENASYGLTVCGERTAIFKAVSSGYQKFKALAVVADTPDACSPCGACRQVMAEFKIPLIIMSNMNDKTKTMSWDELLPFAFVLD